MGGISFIAPLLIFLSSSEEEERTKEGACKLCTGLHLGQLIIRSFAFYLWSELRTGARGHEVYHCKRNLCKSLFCLNLASTPSPHHPTGHQSTAKLVTFAVFGCHNYPQPPLWSATGWNIAAGGARRPTSAIFQAVSLQRGSCAIIYRV